MDDRRGLRWLANIELWHWRLLLPVSGALELAAFALFFGVVSRHRPQACGKTGFDPWIWVVISKTLGLGLLLVSNLAACLGVALHGAGPEFAHGFDQRYLALMAWGFLMPFVWGFSAKWMPVFLGLARMRASWLLTAVAANFAGVLLTFAGLGGLATWLFAAGTVLAIAALRMFEPAQKQPKIRGVHSSFPFFVRAAYGWQLISALFGNRSGPVGYVRRYLGRVPSRAHRGVCFSDGTERGSARATRLCGDASALEHLVDVCGAGVAHHRLHTARLVRGAGLSRLRRLGLAGPAGVGRS